MSGGSFNYAFMSVDQFADDLNVKLVEIGIDDLNVYRKLREIEQLSRLTAKLMKEVEWLYSGDTGEESFMKRVKLIDSEFDLEQKYEASKQEILRQQE